MMNGAHFGLVAESYSRSRNDIPHQLFESLQLRNIYFAGKKVADIGCGTGVLTRKIKIRNAQVIGVDPSPQLLEKANVSSEEDFLSIPYVLGTAEQTGLDSTAFDIVTVMRAWHWFDREQTIEEINRILKPKGTLLIMDSGFLTESTLVMQTFSAMEKFITGGIKPAGSKAQSKQRINGFPVEWFEEWRQNKFDVRDFYKFDYTVSFTNEEWVDRIESISWMTGLKEDEREIAKFKLLDTLKEQFGEEVIHSVPHYCTVCILTKQ
ncbi:class I SAM-dependent methyltransferase [Neobacillus sp. D3-1R]|uniref:class I SAM-dependent methyltransferase n=1 Tax=Neobacillus sp. D3-1R TaxID=3445778 RepID=UPI003F9F822F